MPAVVVAVVLLPGLGPPIIASAGKGPPGPQDHLASAGKRPQGPGPRDLLVASSAGQGPPGHDSAGQGPPRPQDLIALRGLASPGQWPETSWAPGPPS